MRRTYYLGYANSKIITESKFGLGVDLRQAHIPFQLHAFYCIPWYKGYLEQRQEYLSVKLGYLF